MLHEKPKTPFYKNIYFYLKTLAAAAAAFLILFLLSVIALRWTNPPFTSFTLQENWEQLDAERYNLKNYWVSIQDIPEHTQLAVIASEDQLFWEHRGFDIDSIREARREINEGKRVRGASTITQQVAKNLYLSPSQSYIRKGAEAVITVLIELFWSKDRILEVYLNIAEFGPGIFGIGKASDTFFGIGPNALEPDMSARLATVLPSPKRMRAEPASPFVQERSQWVLAQMTRISGIPYLPEPEEEEQRELQDDPLILTAELELNKLLNGYGNETPAKTDTVINRVMFRHTVADSSERNTMSRLQRVQN